MPIRKKLTALAIEKLPVPQTGRLEYFDTVVPQLALRVTASGHKSFAVRMRVSGGGRQVRTTLGEWPSTKLESARQAARDALNAAKTGVSPTEVKRQEREERREREANDFESVADEFVERYAKRRNRTWHETARILDRYVKPEWRGRPISDVRKKDVVRLLDHIEDRSGVYMANRTLAVVRKLFNWAMDERGLIDSTPIGRGMARAGEEHRKRHLPDSEIEAVWSAAGMLPYPFGPFVRLLLITGQRRQEVAAMRWDQISEAAWTLPAEATKSNRAHTVPLSDLAVEVLESVPRIGESGLVFSTNGKTPISGFSKAKARLDALSGVSGWRLHDLRATMATRLEAELHVPPHIVGAVLNHDPKAYKGITAVYLRGDPLSAKKDALDAWARLLRQLIHPPHDVNVVKLVTNRQGEAGRTG